MPKKKSATPEHELLLEELVNISSISMNSEAVNHVQTILVRELAALGFRIALKKNPDASVQSGQLLTATLRGDSPEFFTFVSHADTVLDTETTGTFKRSKKGDLAFGSGVIDNKGGLVVAIEGLRRYLKKLKRDGIKRPPYSLRLVISPNEEAGSLGFHDDFKKFAASSILVLGFEPALENGSIVESRRGNRWYQVQITGEPAHAGRCRGEEINAAHDLALKLAKLQKLNKPSAGIGVNVAEIIAGQPRFNIVCGNASAKIDTRFTSFENRDELHAKIEKILLTPEIKSPITGRKSKTTYTIEDDCPPFSSNEKSRRLLRLYLRQISKLEGRKVQAEKAGGAGDVNYMSRKGLVVFDGLGPVGGKMHTAEEFIRLSSLETRSQALANFLEDCATEL